MAEVLLRQKLILPSNHFHLLILLIQQSEKRVMLLTKVFDLITKEKLGCLCTMRLGGLDAESKNSPVTIEYSLTRLVASGKLRQTKKDSATKGTDREEMRGRNPVS